MIIFLYGEDSFRAKEKLNKFKQKFITEVDSSAVNLVELDGKKVTLNDLNKAMATQSFLSKKRMIIIRDILKQNKTQQTEVLELLKKGKYREGQDDNIIIFLDTKVDKRSALFKYLKASKFSEEFIKLKDKVLVKWIQQRVVQIGGRINQAVATYLAERSDGNLWALSNEINKLVAQKGKKEISQEDVEQTYLIQIDDNIFNLTDAVGARNKKLALKLIDEQLSSGVNEIYLLTMIVRQFRILLQLRVELDKGKGNYREIAKELSLHPFVVQKALAQASKYKLDDLKNIYKKLLDADIRLKRGENGRTVLEMLVVGL